MQGHWAIWKHSFEGDELGTTASGRHILLHLRSNNVANIEGDNATDPALEGNPVTWNTTQDFHSMVFDEQYASISPKFPALDY